MVQDTTTPRHATSFYDLSGEYGQQPPTPPTEEQPEDDKPAGASAPQPPSTATPTLTESGGGTTTTTKTTVSGNPYAQFKGNNYDDVIGFIKDRMADYKPETKEEKEKREKREKRTMFLANIANVLGSMHKAYSYQRGVKPMDLPDISGKMRERFEKAKADRDKDADRMLNYAVTLGNLKDKDRDFNFRVTQAEQTQQNWQSQFDAGRKDREDDVAFRDKNFDEGKRRFDVTQAETVRHNKAGEGLQAAGIAEQRRHNKASEGLQRESINLSQDAKYTEFYIPNGGLIKVRNTALNSANLSYVFNNTPDKDGVAEDGKTPINPRPTATTDMSTGKVNPVTSDQMLQWVGSHMSDPKVQAALKNIGGQLTAAPGSKGRGY